MKKLFVFIFLLVIVSVCSLGERTVESILDFLKDAQVEIYTQDIPNAETYSTIKNGQGYIVKMSAKQLNSCNINFFAKTYYINSSLEFYFGLKNKIQVVAENSVDDIQTFYGYLPFQNDFRFVGGKKVNIQVAFNKSTHALAVGFPLIIGSY